MCFLHAAIYPKILIAFLHKSNTYRWQLLLASNHGFLAAVEIIYSHSQQRKFTYVLADCFFSLMMKNMHWKTWYMYVMHFNPRVLFFCSPSYAELLQPHVACDNLNTPCSNFDDKVPG